ncbi:MAG TPA: pyridoxamine 5'-phosphate oxidase family protein [Candidatus Acidoferrum sp.]|nr:pyridoxamine 5'-phosphate oxidase family protein [Candidatus Acidoferrum sp.]
MDAVEVVEVTSPDELRALVGEPVQVVIDKDSDHIDASHRAWLQLSPFCLIGTSSADGTCDVSPKGDPPGFAHVIDEHAIAIPDRPGNKRVDGMHNILSNPHVGLLFMIPGRGDTLRINGRARIVREAPFFDDMIVKGYRPKLALVVDVEQVFFHCPKAFLRSKLWDPASWDPGDAATLEKLEEFYLEQSPKLYKAY